MKTRAFDPIEKRWRTDYVVMPDGSIHRSFKVDNGVEFMEFYEIAEQVNWKLSLFTKLRDNDNQMVWEYDIYEHLRFKFVVRFHNGTFVLMHISGNVANQSIWAVRHLHKLGDIFTTPELLEEVK